MGKFIKSIVIKTEFDGDNVTMTVRPMDQATAIKLRNIQRKDPSGAPNDEGMNTMLSSFSEHLESVEGVTDADGNEVVLGEIKSSAYFIGLLSHGAIEWSSRSIPGSVPGNWSPSVK